MSHYPTAYLEERKRQALLEADIANAEAFKAECLARKAQAEVAVRNAAVDAEEYVAQSIARVATVQEKLRLLSAEVEEAIAHARTRMHRAQHFDT